MDGKTVCGASTPDETLHLVSAWLREDGLTMGQLRTHEKSNEITAIPALLKDLAIAHSVVSIDAMGCQKKIADTILGKQIISWRSKAISQHYLMKFMNILLERAKILLSGIIWTNIATETMNMAESFIIV